MSKTDIEKIMQALNEINYKKDMISIVQNEADDVVQMAISKIAKDEYKKSLKSKQLDSFNDIDAETPKIADIIVKELLGEYISEQQGALVVPKHIRLSLLQNCILEGWAKKERTTTSQLMRDIIVEKVNEWAEVN